MIPLAAIDHVQITVGPEHMDATQLAEIVRASPKRPSLGELGLADVQE